MPELSAEMMQSRGAALASDLPVLKQEVVAELNQFTPPMQTIFLPGFLSGQTGYSGRSYTQDSVVTTSTDQYAAWYDSTGALLLGKRPIDSAVWSTFSMGAIAGNPLVLPVDTDSHNTVSIALDRAGYIHVAANMHGDQLRYVRSGNPFDITAWTVPGMTGLNETQVSYPRFLLPEAGPLLFMYRDGASGSGDIYLNRYVEGAWAQVGMIAAGKATNESPYESRFAERNGKIAVSFTWRPNGGDHNTNNDVHYIESANFGDTWTSVAGAPVSLPLTHANTSARVLTTAATNSGIINQFGLDLDIQGRPHIALTLADGSTPDRNIHHLYWTGAAWVNQQVTDLRNGMGFNNMPTRPAIACTDDGRTVILTSYPRILGRSGSFRIIDVTDGARTDVPVALLDGRDWEITYDTRSLRQRNALVMMLSQCNADVSTPGPNYWNINNWSSQYGLIAEIDLKQLGAVLREEARLPIIRTVATINSPNNGSVTATGDTLVPGTGGVLTFPELLGRQVFARLTARASVNAGTLTLSAFEVQQGGTSRLFGSVPFTANTTVIRSTPWMPLTVGPINGLDAMVQALGRVSSGNTGTVSTLCLELGVMDS